MMNRQFDEIYARNKIAPASTSRVEEAPTQAGFMDAGQALIQLQHTHGNQFVQHAIGQAPAPIIQPKLVLGAVGDSYEREADRIASQATSGEGTGAPQIQRMNGATGGALDPGVQQAILQARGGGQPLPQGIRGAMEQSLGEDFSRVRVHTGAQADQLSRSLQAQAFTTGRDIFFRHGGYDLGSADGQQLLAHELTHVAQQASVSSGPAPIQRKGVKSELIQAQSNYQRYKKDVQSIDNLQETYIHALYNAYKPNLNDPNQYYQDNTDRDKDDGSLDVDLAREKAQRLNHWTANATASSNRLFEELIAATQLADARGKGYEKITLGTDTKTEPDVFLGRREALEVKHIDSEAYSAVDTHVKKGTKQLTKRLRNEVEKSKVKERTLHLRIKDPANTWPFTPTELAGIKKPNKKRTEKALKARAKKYKSGKQPMNLVLSSNNPLIGDIDIEF